MLYAWLFIYANFLLNKVQVKHFDQMYITLEFKMDFYQIEIIRF